MCLRNGIRALGPLGAALVGLALAGCAREQRVVVEQPFDGSAWPTDRPGYPIEPRALSVVSNNASDTLSLLDLDKNAVVASPPVDLDPIGNDGPHHVVVAGKGEWLFTPLSYPALSADLGPHAAHGASTVPGILLKLRARDLTRVGTLTVFDNPGDLALTPDGTKVLVTHFDLAKALDAAKKGKPVEDMRSPLAVVDAATLSLLGRPAPCVAAHGIAVAQDGKRAYLACYGEDAVAVVKLDDPAFGAELVPIGAALAVPPAITYGPYFVVLSPTGKELVVAESAGKELRAIDLATRTTVGKVDTRGAAFGPASTEDGATWIVPAQQPDALFLVDAKTWSQTGTRSFSGDECVRPHQVARRGARFFVVCEGDHVAPGKVIEIDPASLATLRSFAVGVYPDAIAFSPGVP